MILVAANQCLYLFVDEVIHLVFLLNRRYKIFYKWSNRALLDLKILGKEIHKLLEDMVFAQNKIPYVRKICKVLAEEIKNQKLTNCSSEFFRGFRSGYSKKYRMMSSLKITLHGWIK